VKDPAYCGLGESKDFLGYAVHPDNPRCIYVIVCSSTPAVSFANIY